MKNIFAALLLLVASVSTTNAATLVGHVVGVTDGDTITLLDASQTQYKIRLAGIDAPEKKQAFGNASKKALSDLVFDQVVSVKWDKQDRYGRIVGKVLIKDFDVNLAQVKHGYAWFYKKYQKELEQQDRLDYLHAQDTAEEQRLGLWIDNEPIPPWEYRKK